MPDRDNIVLLLSAVGFILRRLKGLGVVDVFGLVAVEAAGELATRGKEAEDGKRTRPGRHHRRGQTWWLMKRKTSLTESVSLSKHD